MIPVSENIREFVHKRCGCGGVDEVEVGCCEEGYEELAVGADGDVFDPSWEGELVD